MAEHGSTITEHGAAAAEHGSTTIYWVIFAALMVLLAATIGVAYIPLGKFNVLVALSIATLKAVLVLLYFMHVRHSPRLTWLFAGAGFAWLALMIGLTLGDYLTREKLAAAEKLPHPGRPGTSEVVPPDSGAPSHHE